MLLSGYSKLCIGFGFEKINRVNIRDKYIIYLALYYYYFKIVSNNNKKNKLQNVNQISV
jgi:hypothetical protein